MNLSIEFLFLSPLSHSLTLVLLRVRTNARKGREAERRVRDSEKVVYQKEEEFKQSAMGKEEKMEPFQAFIIALLKDENQQRESPGKRDIALVS